MPEGASFFLLWCSFDDLHVEVVAEDFRHVLEHLEADVDADRHVGGEHRRDVPGQLRGQRPLLRGEAGGADDDRLAVQAADLQVLQRNLRDGEVDQDVAALDHGIQVVGDRHAEGAAAGDQPGILADQLVPRPLQGAGQLAPFGLLDGNDDSLAHASGGAADSYFNHR